MVCFAVYGTHEERCSGSERRSVSQVDTVDGTEWLIVPRVLDEMSKGAARPGSSHATLCCGR
jgi:hypothetical protein